MRDEILATLDLDELTANWFITITLADEDGFRLARKMNVDVRLGQALKSFFGETDPANRVPTVVTVPEPLNNHISRILVEPWDLTDGPRVTIENQPVIVFSAQNVHVVPEKEFPLIAHRVLDENVATLSTNRPGSSFGVRILPLEVSESNS